MRRGRAGCGNIGRRMPAVAMAVLCILVATDLCASTLPLREDGPRPVRLPSTVGVLREIRLWFWMRAPIEQTALRLSPRLKHCRPHLGALTRDAPCDVCREPASVCLCAVGGGLGICSQRSIKSSLIAIATVSRRQSSATPRKDQLVATATGSSLHYGARFFQASRW